MMWKCPLCGAELPPEEVAKHVLEKHSGRVETFLVCSVCGARFEEPKDYYRHLKKKHPRKYESLKEEARKHPEFYKKTLEAIEELERGESKLKIAPTHDYFFVKIGEEYYEAKPEWDGLWHPKQWVEEMLRVQEMTPEEFMRKYKPRKVKEIPWPEFLRTWTRPELEEAIKSIRFKHRLPPTLEEAGL
jgi:uncharacterized C2H2 Zn-finger protein